MKKNNEENRHAESLEESLETLLGREADLSDAELEEELNDCGIDPAELQANVHKRLFDYANHHYRTLDKEVPIYLENIIRALRPPSNAERVSTIARTAQNVVGRFLDPSKAKSSELLSTILPIQTRQAQFAFRNKKELSAADIELLIAEQEEVDSSDE